MLIDYIYMDEKVLVAFKPEASDSEIENMLTQYEHGKLFGDMEFDLKAERNEQMLARTYVLIVSKVKEDWRIQQILNQYSPIIEYAERVPARKIVSKF